MLENCILCEKMKLRRSPMWIAFVLFPIVPAALGTGNYLNNIELLKSEWFSLWTQETLFYSNFFFAPLIAVYCGYLWRIENRNRNRHLLMTMPVPARDIFLGKLASITKITLFTQIWVFVLFVLTGRMVSLSGMPPAIILLYAVRGTLGGLAVAALQLMLSMIIRSFATPIAIAVFGAVTGLLASNSRYAVCYPYSLMMVGMNANRSEDILQGNPLPFFVSCLVWLTLFCAVSVYYLKHTDVRA